MYTISNQQCLMHYLARHGIEFTNTAATLTSKDYGPQVWDNEGHQGDMTEVENCFMVDNGEVRRYYGRDELVAHPIVMPEYEQEDMPTKVRTELTDDENNWLHAHEAYLPQVDNDNASEWECNVFEDEVCNDEMPTLAEANYSKEATEMTKDEYEFWGKVKFFTRANPTKGLEYVNNHVYANWLDIPAGNEWHTARNYARELMGTEPNITKHYYHAKYERWCKATVSMGYRRYLVYQAVQTLRIMPDIDRKLPEDKVVHIDYFKSIPSAPEGFANIWTTVDDAYTGSHQVRFSSRQHAVNNIQPILNRAHKAGYTQVTTRDMYHLCIEATGRSPKYITAKRLWETPKNYAKQTVDVSVLV